MNYGLYLSASGVLTNMYRQDVYANNLANASTVGFKRDLASISQRDPESIEGGHAMQWRHNLLDQLGGGVFAGRQQISFQQGAMEKTGNALDMAIDGSDGFFVVNKSNGAGQAELRFTRDGRFTRNAEGFLVTVAGGLNVLDPEDRPIKLADGGPISVTDDGRIRQNGEEVARIQVANVIDRERLRKDGGNLMKYEGAGDGRTAAGNVRVRSGFVESSGVDPIRELLGLIETNGAVQLNAQMIKHHDQLMDRAVNSLGRVNA
ncbi:MAG: flagellar hook-basal body protein [Phycisphaeraceae bacterium]